MLPRLCTSYRTLWTNFNLTFFKPKNTFNSPVMSNSQNLNMLKKSIVHVIRACQFTDISTIKISQILWIYLNDYALVIGLIYYALVIGHKWFTNMYFQADRWRIVHTNSSTCSMPGNTTIPVAFLHTNGYCKVSQRPVFPLFSHNRHNDNTGPPPSHTPTHNPQATPAIM